MVPCFGFSVYCWPDFSISIRLHWQPVPIFYRDPTYTILFLLSINRRVFCSGKVFIEYTQNYHYPLNAANYKQNFILSYKNKKSKFV